MPPTGIINQSMRENYNSFGVENYYGLVSESYRNPHYPGLKKVLSQLMDTYVTKERPESIKVLDLAAGSGEATEALLSWKSSRWPATNTPPHPSSPPSPPPIPGSSGTSPNSEPSTRLRPPVVQPRPFIPRPASSSSSSSSRVPVARPSRTGSGTAVSSIREPTLSITAADPFTGPAYRQRTGLPCLELSFNQIAQGLLPPPPPPPPPPPTNRSRGTEEGGGGGGNKDDEEEKDKAELYDLVIVSFALHLVESSSELWALLNELGKRSRWLCVVAPHKKPEIKTTWGWRRWDPSLSSWKPAEGRGNVGGSEGDGFEIVLDRVRLRLWRSEENWEEQYA